MARKQHRAILLQDVDHLGARGDVVSVKSGYLRNYLVPRRLAEQATEARIAEIKQTESVRAKQQARTTEQAQEIARTLTTTILTIPVLAGRGRPPLRLRHAGRHRRRDLARAQDPRRPPQGAARRADPPARHVPGRHRGLPRGRRDRQDDGRARRGLDVRPARTRGRDRAGPVCGPARSFFLVFPQPCGIAANCAIAARRARRGAGRRG